MKGTLMPTSKNSRRNTKVPRLGPGESGTVSVEMKTPHQTGVLSNS